MKRREMCAGAPQLVDTGEALEECLDVIDRHDRLAVDTEANSMHAYRERLCLIQVSVPGADFLIDPLAEFDLDPFLAVLEDRHVVKVFHDAEFDILQLRRAYDLRLRGLFDTKVAALAIGETAVGLAALVDANFGVTLDKAMQRSDWGRRPLTPEQLEYAALDVRYLLDLADLLDKRMDELDPIVRYEFDSECSRLEHLEAPELVSDPDAWARIKGAQRMTPRELRNLRELYSWREKEAERRDRPPFKIIGNHMLVAIAQTRVRSLDELEKVKGIPKAVARRWGPAIVKVLGAAAQKPGLERPKGKSRRRQPPDEDRAVLDRLKRWRKSVAAARPTDPSLVLNREVLETLAMQHPRPATREDLAATELLEEWRIDAYGEDILRAIAE